MEINIDIFYLQCYTLVNQNRLPAANLISSAEFAYSKKIFARQPQRFYLFWHCFLAFDLKKKKIVYK